MTESRFSDLVNLYLDEELSSQERMELEQVLLKSPERRKEFDARLRLHAAMRQAFLSPQERALERMAKEPIQRRKLFKWALFPIGMAASVLVGFLLAANMIVKSSDSVSDAFLSDFGVSESSQDHLIGDYFPPQSESSSSVAAHLRLLGLRPGMVEETSSLSAVDMVAYREAQQARLKLINSLRPAGYATSMESSAKFKLSSQPQQALSGEFGFSLANFD